MHGGRLGRRLGTVSEKGSKIRARGQSCLKLKEYDDPFTVFMVPYSQAIPEENCFEVRCLFSQKLIKQLAGSVRKGIKMIPDLAPLFSTERKRVSFV